MIKVFILVCMAELWFTTGQICLKKSANHLGLEAGDGKPWIIRLMGAVFRHPVLWAGMASILVGLLFWFAALAAGDLSIVYLLGSIQYVLVLFAAHFFLGEKIDAAKLTGTLLVLMGIVFITVSG